MATMQEFPTQSQFLQAPLQAPPAVVADPKLVQLKSMFPEIEADVLEAMLMFHQGDVERAVSMILDTPQAEDTQANLDEAVARALQQQLDLELAQGVDAEMRAEEAARRQAQPVNRAATAVESAAQKAAQKAAASAKNLLAKMRGRTTSATHGTRLLDAPSDDSAVASSWAPLTLPAYSPNYNTTDSSAAAAPAVDISEPAAPTPSPPNANGGSRYSARMERARSANMQNQRSSARLPVGEQPAAAQVVAVPAPAATAPQQAAAQVEVPVGELI